MIISLFVPHRYKIIVGGKQIYSIVNRRAEEFKNVKVYASDPWSNAAKASIRNLVLDMPEEVEAFYFSEGTSDFTQLSYDGKFLTCTGSFHCCLLLFETVQRTSIRLYGVRSDVRLISKIKK